MVYVCGDPYFPPCMRCHRCREARPEPPEQAPAEQEPATYGHPKYDPDPEESEPSEAETEPLEDESEPSEAESEPLEDESGPSEAESEPSEDESEPSEAEFDSSEEVSSDEGAMDLDEPEGESEDDNDDYGIAPMADEGNEATVEDPLAARTRVTIRRRDEPLPPPSHRVYRHPGGVRWMYTPRKRVPAIQSRDVFRAPLPAPEAPIPPPVTPEWITRLRSWSMDQGLPPPVGRGQTVFEHGESSTANRALPVMVNRITSMEDSIANYQDLTLGLNEVVHHAASRAQELTNAQNQRDHHMQLLTDELWEAQGEIGRLRASEAEARGRVASLVEYVRVLGEQLQAAHEATQRLEDRLTRRGL